MSASLLRSSDLQPTIFSRCHFPMHLTASTRNLPFEIVVHEYLDPSSLGAAAGSSTVIISCVTCATLTTYNFINIAAWLVINFQIPLMDKLKEVILSAGEFQLDDKGYMRFYKRQEYKPCHQKGFGELEDFDGRIEKLTDAETIKVMAVKNCLSDAVRIVRREASEESNCENVEGNGAEDSPGSAECPSHNLLI
ncbi:hypothetical protein GCK72_026175 [Caenorhabditis remanei]|uniref:Uncharacterized protein n=1 Tax=Caenorhabditis remanei TaxID=31234 RepID=A0A6A5G437_CAERE|nr:hypothetical protein GCK72_026175 [Caenorhabditis remanei]KAF1749707.1 hypothetical protein GCK72_026175 [Caenorhabditis remanei]